MKIDKKLLRVREWLDADTHETVFVAEMFRQDRWVGVMLSGTPMVFTNRDDANALLADLAGLEVPDKDISHRLECVSQFKNGKGIVPPELKHLIQN